MNLNNSSLLYKFVEKWDKFCTMEKLDNLKY